MVLHAQADPQMIRAFDPEEIFFSITDKKGVITHSNETFERLAEYPRAELVGAPHNIIRHPDMPGGAFALLWEDLEAGRTVGAYVANKASSGMRYDVFAVITPVGNSYLSIRLRPELNDTRELLYSVYDEIRANELVARSEGVSAREAAQEGGLALRNALSDLGHASLADSVRTFLPQEVLAHYRVARRDSWLPDQEGPLRSLIESADCLNDEMNELARGLGELVALADRLQAIGKQFDPARDGFVAISETLSSVIKMLAGVTHTGDHYGRLPELVATSRGMRDQVLDAQVALDSISPMLAEILDTAREGALAVSTLSLVAMMLATFGREVSESGDEGSRAEEMDVLHRALHDRALEIGGSIARLESAQQGFPQALAGAVADVDRTRRRLVRWRGAIEQVCVDGLLGEQGDAIIDAADEVMKLSDGTSALLAQIMRVGAGLELLQLPFDGELTDERIERIGGLVAELGAKRE